MPSRSRREHRRKVSRWKRQKGWDTTAMGLIDINKTTTLEHPSEDATVVIRPLRGIEMDEAAEVKTKRTFLGWGDTIEAIQKLNLAKQDESDTIASRIQRYDATTLLRYAVVSWSYSETVTPQGIDDLDAVTRDWLVEEVVTRNTRPLPPSKGGDASLNLGGFHQN